MAAPERRALIERCATEVFAEHGYRGASMSEIARRAGVTVPVLYDHFDSKLELHRRLLERTRNELLEVWREHLGGSEPLNVRVPAFISVEIQLRSADGAAYALRFGDVTIRSGGSRSSTSKTIDGLRPNESIVGVPQGAGNRVRISATAEPGP